MWSFYISWFSFFDPLRNFEPFTLFSIALTSSSQIKHKNAYENTQAIIYLLYKQQQKHKFVTFYLKTYCFKKEKNILNILSFKIKILIGKKNDGAVPPVFMNLDQWQ